MSNGSLVYPVKLIGSIIESSEMSSDVSQCRGAIMGAYVVVSVRVLPSSYSYYFERELVAYLLADIYSAIGVKGVDSLDLVGDEAYGEVDAFIFYFFNQYNLIHIF